MSPAQVHAHIAENCELRQGEMARACLNLSSEVTDAFAAALQSGSTRALKVSVKDEDLVLSCALPSEGTAEHDFNSLLPSILGDNEAALVLFCLDNEKLEGRAMRWMLFAWIPDTCKVRDKMLYSSSREDLKRNLGLGHFTAEYYANTKSEVTWDQFTAYDTKEHSSQPLTAKEQLILDEKALTQSESNATKSTAMGSLPFALADSVLPTLQRFAAGEINFVEIKLDNEAVDVVSSQTTSSGNIEPLIDAAEARFVLYSTTSNDTKFCFFIYSCPESTPVRMKMTMSSGKSSVISVAVSVGIKFDRTIEIREPNEVDAAIAAEVAVNGSGPSSAAAHIMSAKPARPGRGKTRIAKFKADENA